MTTFPVPAVCQIAFSAIDLERTHEWYRETLGFLPSGGTGIVRGPLFSRLVGLPKLATTIRFLVDKQDFFHFEMFRFERPQAKPMPAEWRPCDIGYVRLGLHVDDFDATLERLGKAGVRPLTDPIGAASTRRVCVRDPEGVLLELMEDDPRLPDAPPRSRPEVPVAARSITVSVPDLDRSRHFFVDTLGMREANEIVLHSPEHEALWGLAGAQRKSLLLWAGDFLVELVQYTDPIGKPWPEGHRVCDQGLSHIALGFRSLREFNAVYRRAAAAGYKPNWRPLHMLAISAVYLNDDQGFAVEMMAVRRWFDRFLGFRPKRQRVTP
jgi:catechol 2,3-dioxygenase-like lactoylglutathione lyase family enzyme